MKQLLFLLVLFTSQVFAQPKIDSIVANKTKELKSKGIKQFFFYNTYCIGSFRLVKVGEIDCSVEGSFIYLFWQEENKNYVQSLGSCELKKVEIPSQIFDFYLKNYTKIKDEKVKPYQTGKNGFTSISHSCHKRLIFNTDSKEVSKKFDEFDLTTEVKNPNVNFEINNSLNLVLLANLCEKTVKDNFPK